MRALFFASLCKTLTSIVLLSALFACGDRLKDYTQITLQTTAPEDTETKDTEIKDTEDAKKVVDKAVEAGSAENTSAENTSAENSQESADALEAAKETLENRLMGLGIELAEVETAEPNQIIVKVPPEVNAQALQSLLTNTGQLYLRNQKPDTTEKLAQGIEALQRLLVEQNTLMQTDKQTEAAALQSQIDEARGAIANLFEPSDLTGNMLHDARARPSDSAPGTWDVNIQFNEEGAERFAAQTKRMAGTGRAVGLFLDDVLLSAPVVDVNYAQTGITGGTAIISGNFTQDAAKTLEIQLKSGALPVKLETVEVVSTDNENNPKE